MYFMTMFSSSYVDVLFISQNFDRHLLEKIARNGVLISEKFQHSVRSGRSVRPPQRRDRHSELGDKRHQFKFTYLKLFLALPSIRFPSRHERHVHWHGKCQLPQGKAKYLVWKLPVCCIQNTTNPGMPGLGPALLMRHDAVARILANGSAAFIESCAAIGWNSCDSVRSL